MYRKQKEFHFLFSDKLLCQNVHKDYKGFTIDKDNNFEKDRHDKAFFNDKMYESWWGKFRLVSGLVYIFG